MKTPAILRALAAISCSCLALPTWAAACSSNASGNWSSAATWAAPCNVAGGPQAGDSVSIGGAHTITLTAPAAAASVTVAVPTSANGVTLNGNTLTVSGAVTLSRPTSNNTTSTLAVGSGTLNAASISIAGGSSATRIAQLTVSTGTVNVSGSVSFANTAAQARFISTGASNVYVGGDFGAGGTLTTGGTGTITFNGAGAQSVGTYATYNDVVVAKSGGTATLAGNTTVGGALTVSGGTFDMGNNTLAIGGALNLSAGNMNANNTLSVTGTTSIGGTFTINATTGTKTFTGQVSIAAGGVWNNSANEAVTFQGGLAYAGTSFTAGSGVHTFSTNSQAISGTLSIPSITVTGVTLTNNGNLTVNTALAGTGGLTNGASAQLHLGFTGALGITTLTASASGNLVEYAAAGNQTVKSPAGSTYDQLTLSGSGTKTLPGALSLNGAFILAGTATTSAAGILTLNAGMTLGAGTSFTAGAYVHALKGDFTNSGATFTASTSTFNLLGSSVQNLTGATSFYRLTQNNSAGVVLASNITVSNTMTFTSGNLSTGSNSLIIAAGGSVSRSSGHVIGSLQKNVASGANVSRTFEVGDANAYAPLTLVYASVSVAGNVVVGTTTGEHADAGNGGFDTAQDVNRYWTVTNASVTFTTYSATFTYASGSPVDLDTGVTASIFQVGKADACNGSLQACTWVYPTLSGTPSTTTAAVSGVATSGATATSYFVVGRKLNNFLVEATGGGNIGTQYENASFSIRITARDSTNATIASFTGTVTLTSTCTLATGGGVSANFAGGVLTVSNLSISSTGSCTITATRTGGIETGVSNSFTVSPEVSSFDACEASTPRCTAGAANFDRLYTKLAGQSFSVDLVARHGDGTLSTNFNGSATVDLLANKDVQTGLGANNCPSSQTDTLSLGSVSFSGGRPAAASTTTVAKAYRDVRLRFVCDASNCPPSGVTFCSVDNFAVRPQSFVVTSSNATNTAASGSPTVKTGAGFNLSVTSVAGYDGTPLINNASGMVSGTPNAGALGGSFGAASAATGSATGNAFYYTEVGNFGLAANAIYDASFTSVDQSGDCTADYSTVAVGGKYGCYIGSVAVSQTTGSSGFGRFIPDNFAVAYNTPSFSHTCSSFSYLGQSFAYATAPVMTVTARQGTANGLTNAATQNYAGVYAKLSNDSLTPAAQASRYSRADTLGGGATPALDSSGLPAISGDPGISSFSNGVATLSFSGGSGLSFVRSTTAPSAPFSASIALSVNILDSDGVAYASNPALFSSIAFSGGGSQLFGRLRLSSATGSEKAAIQVPLQTQYWSGQSWVKNSSDNCTVVPRAAVALSAYSGSLNAGNFGSSHVACVATPSSYCDAGNDIKLVGGLSYVQLTAPAPVATGGAYLAINLGASGVDQSCLASHGGTPAGLGWLRGQFGSCAASSTYSADPSAGVSLGVYLGETRKAVHVREVY